MGFYLPTDGPVGVNHVTYIHFLDLNAIVIILGAMYDYKNTIVISVFTTKFTYKFKLKSNFTTWVLIEVI